MSELFDKKCQECQENKEIILRGHLKEIKSDNSLMVYKLLLNAPVDCFRMKEMEV